MKIVINKCYGGFGVSKEVYDLLGLKWDGCGFALENDRTNPKLIDAVEKLGERANGDYAVLKVVEIPDGKDYEIRDYYGKESIHEIHKSWS